MTQLPVPGWTTVPVRSRARMSSRVPQPLRSTSAQGWPNAARSYPVSGARPLTGRVARTASAVCPPGAVPAVEAGADDGLPPTERAAVVLRYGYDLGYDEIGAALGSNETAARQAASSGVRRIRRRKGQ